MKFIKFNIGIIFGFLLGTILSNALAIGVKTPRESMSNDAASVVGYGYDGTTLVPLHVNSSGVVQLQ